MMEYLDYKYDSEFLLESIDFETTESMVEGAPYIHVWMFTLRDSEGKEFHAYLWLYGSHRYGDGVLYESDYFSYISDDFGQLNIEERLEGELDFDQYRQFKSIENPGTPDYLFVYTGSNAEEIAEILTKIYFEEREFIQGVGLRCKVTDEKGETLYSYTCWDVTNKLKDKRITRDTVYHYILKKISVE